ncbi:MAG TPA: hypothetical protein VGE27_10670 [Gemmatimonas sp.]|uniref:TolB family protein n=1 Tax=Gemmatimonas sp. TaxID=1962908 RepID=UPI002ED852D0
MRSPVRRSRIAVAALALGLIGGCSDASGPWRGPPGNGLLLGMADDNGGTQLGIINEDGTGLRKLTRAPGGNAGARWSLDGRRIVFVSWREDRVLGVSLMNPDGSGVRRISDPTKPLTMGAPSWSPDGGRLVYACTIPDSPYGNLCSMSATGTDYQTLLPLHWEAQSADWSPDGQRIVFSGTAPGDPSYRHLYVVDARGGVPVLLSPVKNTLHEMNPVWSPDGTRIAYSVGSPSFGPSVPQDPLPGAYSVKLDGTDAQLITRVGAVSSWIRQPR